MITKGENSHFVFFCKIARINYVYIKFTMVIGLEAFKNKNKVNGRLQSKSAFLQLSMGLCHGQLKSDLTNVPQ